MRLLRILIFFTALCSSAAWASSGQAPAEATSAARSVAMPLNRVRHQQSRSEAEVKRLKRDVIRQQTDSEQASTRLQRQDEAIAELQKQLHALKSRATVGKQ